MEAGNIGPREADVAPAPDPTVRPVGWTPADPGPLGLAAFAATTFMLSMINSDLVVAPVALAALLSLALAYGGIAQLIAGIWEFRTGNTFGAVAFCSYGAFWISFFFLVQSPLKGVPLKEVHSAVGLYLWTWAIFTALHVHRFAADDGRGRAGVPAADDHVHRSWRSATRRWPAPCRRTNSTIKLGGYLGLVTAIAAWYAAFAAVLNSTFGRELLPVFPLGR